MYSATYRLVVTTDQVHAAAAWVNDQGSRALARTNALRCAQRLVDVRPELVDRPVHPLEVVGVVGPELAERRAAVLAEANDDGLAVLPEYCGRRRGSRPE